MGLPENCGDSLDQYHLEVLVDTILVDPVRIEHSEIPTSPPDPLLRRGPETSLRLQVVDTLSHGFTVSRSLGDWLLPVSPPDSDPVDEVALFGLVAESPGLVWSGGTGGSVTDCQLTVFPCSDTREELEDVGLFPGVELGDVLVGAHL